MKKYFIDNTHVMTDYMGGWTDQWIEIGWYDCKSDFYFNLDEVKEIYEKGEADNVGVREDGSLYMKSNWLDARTAFSIICGIPFGVHDEDENLLSYAKKIGLVKENPIPDHGRRHRHPEQRRLLRGKQQNHPGQPGLHHPAAGPMGF